MADHICDTGSCCYDESDEKEASSDYYLMTLWRNHGHGLKIITLNNRDMAFVDFLSSLTSAH